MADNFALRGLLGRFPTTQIPPSELGWITGGAVDPIGDIKTGLWQAAGNVASKWEELAKKAGSKIQNQSVKALIMKAANTNPNMIIPLILKGSTHEAEEELPEPLE